MSTGSTGAVALLQQGAATNLAQLRAYGTAEAAAAAPSQVAANAGTAGAVQAQQGAAQQAAPEPFNAPMLELPDAPTTVDTLDGLSAAMADPTVNRTTAQRLFEFHQQMLDSHKRMIEAFMR